MSDTPMVLEVDCTTGVRTTRPLTGEEIAAHDTAATAFLQMQTAQQAAADAKAAAQASAAAKLAKLGLTADEIAALQS